MTELTLFASTFILVFALGLQSLNVNNGHVLLAVITSYIISTGQMLLYKLAPHANWMEITAYMNGGPLGIYCSMKAHPHLVRWMNGKRKPKSTPIPDWVAGFLNRRVEVEQILFNCAAGKQDLPDKDQCRELALRLGVPDEITAHQGKVPQPASGRWSAPTQRRKV